MSPSAVTTLKAAVRRGLRQVGLDVTRIRPPADPLDALPTFDPGGFVPPGAEADLRLDHPRLVELRARYANCSAPMAERTMWAESYVERQVDLTHFRGDNAFVWQVRNAGAMAAYRYYFYLRDLASRDSRGLLSALTEDGAFGCWTFTFPGWPPVSRDLLDSVNELYFLDRHLGVLDSAWTVLDIGAGYGRLAHRILAAAPGLDRYICTDGVADSTFLCEYYLRFRGCDRVEVVPLDELDKVLPGRRVDLAVNIHSFSEMSVAAISGWLSLLSDLAVPWLLVVPNDAEQFLSVEGDGERRDFLPLFGRHGYELAHVEPVFRDVTLREFMNVTDHFFLFRRAGDG